MSHRYAVAGGLVVLGLLLGAQGALTTPTATVVECSGSSSAEATASTPTPDCTRYTERAWGQQGYVVALGLDVASLGVGIVLADRRVDGR